jgi:hypothetical protein
MNNIVLFSLIFIDAVGLFIILLLYTSLYTYLYSKISSIKMKSFMSGTAFSRKGSYLLVTATGHEFKQAKEKNEIIFWQVHTTQALFYFHTYNLFKIRNKFFGIMINKKILCLGS